MPKSNKREQLIDSTKKPKKKIARDGLLSKESFMQEIANETLFKPGDPYYDKARIDVELKDEAGPRFTGHGADVGEKSMGLERLVEKQLLDIDSISDKIKLLTKYKDDYEKLKKVIEKLPDKTRHSHRIPIGGTNLAFINGQIIHTNELHVLLGYNYFALRSAKQALQIIDRRLVDINEKLKLSEDSYRKTKEWLKFTKQHKQDKEEFVEIIESM